MAGAEAGTVAGGEVGIEVGTVACTEAAAEHGSEMMVWPLHGTGWRKPRRKWRNPGWSGCSKNLGSAGWD